jgi:hypothetical protein
MKRNRLTSLILALAFLFSSAGVSTAYERLNTAAFNANSTAWQDIYTVPANKSGAIVLFFVLRSPTEDFVVGNAGAPEFRRDVLSTLFTMSETFTIANFNSDDNDKYVILRPSAAVRQPMLEATNKVQARILTTHGDSGTIQIDVFGYTF